MDPQLKILWKLKAIVPSANEVADSVLVLEISGSFMGGGLLKDICFQANDFWKKHNTFRRCVDSCGYVKMLRRQIVLGYPLAINGKGYLGLGEVHRR